MVIGDNPQLKMGGRLLPPAGRRPKVVEKHVANIFDKLGLIPDDNDNRRVIAALRYLES